MASSNSLIERLGRRVVYGWVIVCVGMLGIFSSGPAQSHTFSVFIGPIALDLGLTQTEMASAYGLATMMAALCLPAMGWFLDRAGAKRMLAVVALLFGSACAAFGLVGGLFLLAIGFAALRFLGQGSLMMGSSNMVSQWFNRKRGTALGLMTLGFGISMAVHPELSQWLIEWVGWREAWFWIGVTTWILVLPPIVILAISKPEDVGLHPDGVNRSSTDEDGAESVGPQMDFTLSEALRAPAFYIVAASLFTLSMLVTSLHFYQVSIFADQGLGPNIATKCFAVSSVTMIVMMPVVGRMLDQAPTERMVAAGLIVLTASLLLASVISGLWTAVLFAVVFGLLNAVSMNYVSYMWPRYFGRAHLGRIQGVGQTITVIGASLGPLPLAISKDYFGSYDPMLVGVGAMPLFFAVIAFLFLRDPVRSVSKDATP
ncbi:MAG: MFS transporter [Pseudomonadota bacterium]|nr:MFS transporter [Pseudomonadota bacterium]